MANDINMLEDIEFFDKLMKTDLVDDLSRCYRDRYINTDESKARESKQDFIEKWEFWENWY